ncbi:methyl-accepting chemotaxis protein, partial [Rhodopseudomonas sp. B29]|uniref:methyl-accepting chemotaxis protein n=1 Tax=Rhodopseudomonas sp. B29 TaxID=95607 RepID=UPI0003B3EBC5
MAFRLSLAHKINSIAVVGIVGVLALGGIYMTSNASLKSARRADEHARSIGDANARLQIALLEQRRAEKNFLLRKDEQYLAQFKQSGKTAADNLTEMFRLIDPATEQDLATRLKAIQAGSDSYAKQFSDLAAEQIKLGLKEDLGLEGSLRKSVREIETALKPLDAPQLTADLLMMRRHEKDFMLRRNPKYGDDMKSRAAEFSKQLAAADLPEAAKVDITQKLRSYQRDFFAWTEGALAIEQAEKAMVVTFRTLQPQLDELAVVVRDTTDKAKAHATEVRAATETRMEIAIAAIIAAVALLGLLIGRSVSKPLGGLSEGIRRLGDGELDFVLPGLQRSDEVGDMARAVESCKLKAQERAEAEAAAKAQQDRLAAEQRKRDMIELADRFEGAVGEIVETVSSASTELEASATTLTTTAEHARDFTVRVAAASEEASTNVESVASASEEMSASVGEISRQVQEAARIARAAEAQALQTNDRVGELSVAAGRINDVVELIHSIAAQTNLLALNATIEAARAGDAGRGFAVVASEVKALAEQTAKATEQIGQQIGGIQGATQQSVSAIKEIGGTIAR